jgi:hypothetical protein
MAGGFSKQQIIPIGPHPDIPPRPEIPPRPGFLPHPDIPPRIGFLQLLVENQRRLIYNGRKRQID